ncbi:MAG: Xaa-Pro peptidase family protein [Clostridium sp.]|uniref:aminopeptidase P family protein n=1 Tax=Clostridium sp. TaxID=1506 RepID=UPI001EC91BDE|nr:Xaa-Pro peptidase family protein [Clostridium sp.]MBS5885069.1 aminopeptidase P family protein [Clostridium sp.]MDU7148565.1 Xaa-Pro peptidase family protein [Clostridium sp.]
MKERRDKFRKVLIDNDIDAILIKSKSNKRYIGALPGSGVKVLITKDDDYQIMDGRYINEASEVTSGFTNIVHEQGKNYIKVVKEILGSRNRIGVEPNQILLKEYLNLKDFDLEINLLNDELEWIRRCKDIYEIKSIKKACEITDKVFKEILDNIRIGMKEYELSALIQYLSISNGASGMAFDTIVASGKRGSMPHGRPTDKEFAAHEFITIDFGIIYEGYQSDMTRTICIDEPDPKLKKIYDIVLEAQMAGVNYIKAGVACKDVDKHVRDIISGYGFGEYFTHGLGHGIGIGDGELPILNSKSNTILEEGMVMSCEPGIYIPNTCGVRIEDDVLIENGVGVVLNNTSKDLIILEGK